MSQSEGGFLLPSTEADFNKVLIGRRSRKNDFCALLRIHKSAVERQKAFLRDLC